MKDRKSFTPIKRKAYLDQLRNGGRICQSAKNIGIDVSVLYEYLKIHPEFKDEMDYAELDACAPVENKAYELALAGNTTMIMFWLQNRGSRRWRDCRQPTQINNFIEKEKQPDKKDLAKELETMLKSVKV